MMFLPVMSGPDTAHGYVIVGPYPCQESHFQYCKNTLANTSTSATIYVGAPNGIPQTGGEKLLGQALTFNVCRLK
jgi:hypothetical protein